MITSSRVINSIKNVGIGSLLQMFALLLSFVSRTIFINLLGNDYLSVDGLFTNVLTILSFTEFGLGSAIIYSLYAPIANDDKITINKLLNFYSDAYRLIAITITLLGVLVIPFLDLLISDVPDIKEDIVLLYCLFLVNTVSTYIFSYKGTYLIADQKNYVVLLIQQAVNVVKVVLQIVFLYYTRNYIVYLIIIISCTLINNVAITLYVNKKYTWIKNKSKEKLSIAEKKPIFDNVKSIIFYKLGSVILHGSDNIIISIVLKTTLVGLVSNYVMIVSAINAIVSQGFSGLSAVIGNYNIKADSVSNERVFEQLSLISFWVFAILSVSLACLLNPFILLWLGEDYILPEVVVFSLVAAFYFLVINTIPYSYRTAMGLFKESRMAPLLASGINILLSVLLAKLIGLAGVFIATAISRGVTFCVIDPYFIYNKGFGKSSKKYFTLFIYRIILVFSAILITRYAILSVNLDGIVGFLIKTIISIVIVNIIFLVVHFRNETCLQVWRRFRSILALRFNKVKL